VRLVTKSNEKDSSRTDELDLNVNQSINQSKTDLYSAIRRERIRGVPDSHCLDCLISFRIGVFRPAAIPILV